MAASRNGGPTPPGTLQLENGRALVRTQSSIGILVFRDHARVGTVIISRKLIIELFLINDDRWQALNPPTQVR